MQIINLVISFKIKCYKGAVTTCYIWSSHEYELQHLRWQSYSVTWSWQVIAKTVCDGCSSRCSWESYCSTVDRWSSKQARIMSFIVSDTNTTLLSIHRQSFRNLAREVHFSHIHFCLFVLFICFWFRDPISVGTVWKNLVTPSFIDFSVICTCSLKSNLTRLKICVSSTFWLKVERL